MGVESLSPLGFEPQTFHPIASCFTDYTVPVTLHICRVIILFDIWHLLFPCLLFYDTELTHLTTHTWKELTDVSCQIEYMYRKNGLFAVPVYQALYQKECRLQEEPHV